ncbi:DUF3558 domain-containing protein [Amycolatopsis sp. NPDC051903]|uniref:DUF3558 domain-containing protein n=1 Tax=Amycolatopsis sp. NPDC051903 TaxID=3363936 RepID=UPI0037A63BCF
MTARSALVVFGVALAAGLTACSSGNSPSAPSSSASAPSSTSQALPHSGAPKVPNPVASSILDNQPCQSGLTAAQLTDLLGEAPQGSPDTTAGLGPSCNWTNSEKGSHVDVAYDSESHEGLSGWYENTKPKAVVWRELPAIQGFPAVAHVTSAGDPSTFCQISIGINDQTTVDVSVGLGPAKKGTDPCQAATIAAGMVVTNLKQKAGS